MTAIARANELFGHHISNRSFLGEVLLYLRHGFVVSHENLFAMGRPVAKSDQWPVISDQWEKAIVDPSVPFEYPDTWYVAMAVGELRQLVRQLPFPLPWICFARKFKPGLKFYRTERFLQHA